MSQEERFGLVVKARAVASARDGEYPGWRETAARFNEVDPADYPRTMIRAKLARDPECRREDTRVDLVNYLVMLDEVSEVGGPGVVSHEERMAEAEARWEAKRRVAGPGMEVL